MLPHCTARPSSGRHSQRGFSLIEIVVVVAIMLIIAAIAIPNFLRSRIRANETATVAALRAIATAEVAYETTFKQGYSPDLASLAPPSGGAPRSASAADLIDPILATGQRNGYNFIYAAIDPDGNGEPDQYTVNANPIRVGQTGEKYFYVDQTNVIRQNIGGPASATSDPVPRN